MTQLYQSSVRYSMIKNKDILLTMRIKDLLSALPQYSQLQVSEEVALTEVSLLTNNSKEVIPGSVFVAIKGVKFDAHTVLPTVILNQPVAIILEDEKFVPTEYKGLVCKVPSSREALDQLASRYYGDPSHRLLCIGVTGTNGKTSCTYMLEHILNSVGFTTGVLGTINHHLKEVVWPSTMTTPGPLELQARLNEMSKQGAKSIAMEVSSHALEQNRADGVQFNSVLFTNLTRDHLDYHATMDDYFKAKQRLFTDLLWKSQKSPKFAVVNTDDPWGKKMRVSSQAGIWTYGQNQDADFKFEITKIGFSGTTFQLKTPFGEFEAFVPLVGVHNVYNAVGVVATAATFGIPAPYSLKIMESFAGVPGRMQSVPNIKERHIFVDYAHTPDALENVLRSLCEIQKKENKQNHITVVFGCGGDRDKGKRPIMAQIAEKYAQSVFVTSDNPRTEDPMQIIEDIKKGFLDSSKKYAVQPDRRLAIETAIKQSGEGDVVLIAGKGHEDYQEIGQTKFPFSDFKLAQEISNGI